MPKKDYVNKEGYIATVAGLSATLAGQAADPSTERELPWLSQTQIALEVTVAFNALADGGLRVRILEYMTSGAAATEATPGQEGTVPLTAGSTIRQTFNFTVRSRYYIVELFNLDSAAGRDAGSIVVQVIETPESEESQDGQVNVHNQYWDTEAWQPQLIMAWETGGNLDAITAAVEIMDDWDESDRAKVNLIVGQAGIAAGAGDVGVTVPRVTLAADDPAVVALQIIDDWDESDRAKVNLIVGQAGIAAGAGAVGVTVPRVTLASDDPAVTALQIIDDWDEDDRAAVNPERDITIDEMDATTGWAVANDATINLATTANHITGTAALEFDKVDGSGFTEAYIEKTLSSLELEHFEAHTVIEFTVYLSSLTDVAYIFIRLGDGAGNYNEYRVIDDNLTAGVWNNVAIPASQAEYPVTGTGIDASDVDYVAIGVSFDAENDALADIAFDRIHIHSSLHTFATLGAEVSTVISTANVNVQKIGNQIVNRGAGAVALGTQRNTLASDDPAVVALQIIDDWDESDRAKVNLIVGQAGIAAGAGAVGVTVPRVTLASDDPAVTALNKIDGMSTLGDAVETALTQVIKTVAAIATPEAIAGAGTHFRRATIYAAKAARTANAGIIYLGVTAGNDTQPIILNPGDIFTIEAPPGEKYDFDNWYVDVLNAGDGVIAIYS